MAEGCTIASSNGKRVTESENLFSRTKIEKWQKEKNPGKLQLGDPMYYSTTSGFDSNGDVVKRELAEDDKANMKLLRADMIQSPLPTPLNLEKAKFTMKNYRSKERMDILLAGLMKHGIVGSSKFVCQRGLLICVGLTPYSDVCEYDKSLKIAIQQIGSTIYMYMYPSDTKPKSAPKQTRKQGMQQRIGIKFEQYLTKNADGSSSLDENFDNSLDFGALVKATLGGHKLIISGEVDCVDGNGDLVELKTGMHEMKFVEQWDRMRWWLQCHLLGIKSLVLGKHNGLLSGTCECTDVKAYTPAPQLDIKVKDRTFIWKSEICLAAIHKFLTVVEQEIARKGRNFFLMKRDNSSHYFRFEEASADDEFISPEYARKLLSLDNIASIKRQ